MRSNSICAVLSTWCLIAWCVLLCGCEDTLVRVRPLPAPAIEQPPANLPAELRQRNWTKRVLNPATGKYEEQGSCVYASFDQPPAMAPSMGHRRTLAKQVRWRRIRFATAIQPGRRRHRLRLHTPRRSAIPRLGITHQARRDPLVETVPLLHLHGLGHGYQWAPIRDHPRQQLPRTIRIPRARTILSPVGWIRWIRVGLHRRPNQFDPVEKLRKDQVTQRAGKPMNALEQSIRLRISGGLLFAAALIACLHAATMATMFDAAARRSALTAPSLAELPPLLNPQPASIVTAPAPMPSAPVNIAAQQEIKQQCLNCPDIPDNAHHRQATPPANRHLPLRCRRENTTPTHPKNSTNC